ncbi:malto-oligosyltrehalose trehalohydrolase [Phytohabitans sp. ZYX-F-186]|uniref:Malto-oligosyltrehalose trehalohydrolase n=1 Tax=Phytohabitans maris TaxID=3071409 RepID=A0ABU0ZPC0_9ACTN|nr:malto-oligosyltrehalose trehalohydrolase [Phytohabitans sp. ZYX-F-186]MDQ7908860.1 malto-oligosyltrehalose trehalohydrolase [Phytohabitans sp. ZYX-F-186]
MAEFAVWAPERSRVRVRLDGGRDLDLTRGEDGWWRSTAPATDYAFLLDDGDEPLPDPRSPWQPYGVHGPSRVYDHAAFPWTDAGWTGRALPGGVLYELHVGTFTPEGTFDAAAARLDHLVDLGVTAVELLPVNAFNGIHNWGYDGVCWYAPHEGYGGPDGLKRLVDAAHARGLAVIVDAVYNHFGPSGAYAPRFAPYLAESANTWGRSLNLDGPLSDGVRRYVIDSALMWLRDYHADGLRLDAVHALVDHRAVHLLEELATEVDALAAHLGRPLTLIAESDLNDPRLVTPREAGGYGLHAQWDDDVHHALHALLTGERQGYYADFGSVESVTKVLTHAFFHDGTWSSFRRRAHGRPVDRARIPGHRFVAYLQNHDQVGNRATGDRISDTLSPALLKVGAVLLFTSPFTPMLFMGEEWGARTPWQFFTSHPEPELAAAVAGGRRAEFAAHGWLSDSLSGADARFAGPRSGHQRPVDRVPDPQDPMTFARSHLDWAELDKPAHRELYDFHRSLIALRRDRADLTDPNLDRVTAWPGERSLVVRRGATAVAANLAPHPQRLSLPAAAHATLLVTDPGVAVDGEAVDLPAESAAIMAV